MFKLNYKGDVGDQIGVVMGPNTIGERLEVVSQSFDAMTNKTTLLLKIHRS